MKIDDALRIKLVKAVEKAGGAREFSLRCGINAANISRYLRGIIRSIKDDNWEKLAPFLEDSVAEAEDSPCGDIIRAAPELSAFIAKKMKLARLRDTEALRQKMHFSSYESLRRQLCGKLNWSADTLAKVFEALEIHAGDAPLASPERRILEHAVMKRRGTGVMRMLPLICGIGSSRTEIRGKIPIPLDDERDLRAFHIADARMTPLLSPGDIAIFEVVSGADDLPDNSVAVVRCPDTVSGEDILQCRRIHHIPGGKLVLSCDNPAYNIAVLDCSEISWCAVLRRRITEFL